MSERESSSAAYRERYGTEISRSGRFFYAVIRGAIHGASRLWFRLEIVGREHVPATGGVIVAPVHRSNLDTPVISAITTRRLRYMGKESLWKTRFGAWFFTSLGGFPVERGTADRAALRSCQAVLERGEPLVMFPEGTRQSGPVVEPGRMHDGPAFVAGRTGAPILPIGIGGSERAMPKHAKWIRPRKMTIVIGPPIPAPQGTEGGRPSRRAVAETTETLRVEVQRLFDEAQRRAGLSA
jgi:1-acyl-sn-glycerol-3-phosphate acyltransferase